MDHNTTNRRSFLKAGALVAAPLAAAAPVAVLAGDDSRARLARLEDERAVEALQRKFLRHLNGTGDCGELIASSDTIELGEGMRAIAEDMAHEAELTLADDGLTARSPSPSPTASGEATRSPVPLSWRRSLRWSASIARSSSSRACLARPPSSASAATGATTASGAATIAPVLRNERRSVVVLSISSLLKPAGRTCRRRTCPRAAPARRPRSC